MPRPPRRTRQLLDPMAAFQMVHIMEGVIERGTATVLRDLNRPLFGKTGTTSGPTNVWFVGGTPDVVAGVYLGYDQPRRMGGYAQGGRIAAPIFKQLAQTAFKDEPKVPFVAPAGIRLVRIDRATGKRVFGTFPTDGGSRIVGDLGGVPARDRAAALAIAAPGRSLQRASSNGRSAGRCSAARRSSRDSRAAHSHDASCRAPAPRILAKAGRRLLGRPRTQLSKSIRSCAPKRKPISTRSMPPPRCCAGSSTGTARNRRLEELNAKIEDPKLWDDPKAAQELMRERRRLERGDRRDPRDRARAQRHRRTHRDGRKRRR